MNGFTWDDENLLLTDLSGISILKRRENSLYFDSVNKSRKGPDLFLDFPTFLCTKNIGGVK